MHIERPNWNTKKSDERGVATVTGTAAVVAIIGFIMAISVYGLAVWVVVWMLAEQGAIDWTLEVWQAYAMAAIYLVGRSINRVMYPKA